MKRYRVINADFDARVHSLTTVIQEKWEEQVKKLHLKNRHAVEQELIAQYGQWAAKQKRQNFIDLGAKLFSIIAFHNRFFEQIRTAFVLGAYYPALTGACALGERILNHLIITLRADFKERESYKRVSRKSSFQNWDLAIDVLSDWDVLLPEARDDFLKLKQLRHKAIHFKPETDQNDRELALEAILCLQKIIANQFSAWGTQPWFFVVPGEIYIKKEWEEVPFIKRIYIPNCELVGPEHRVESIIPEWKMCDKNDYPDRAITDDEFSKLRLSKRS